MIVRRGPAVVLSLGLGLAACAMAPASAGEGGPVKGGHVSQRVEPAKDTETCARQSTTRLRVASQDSGVLVATGMVWTQGTDRWSWRFMHNSDLSARGVAKAHPGKGQAFQVTRSMVNLIGPDHFVFRAKNRKDGEVCRVDVFY
jgi:hypothetical protein